MSLPDRELIEAMVAERAKHALIIGEFRTDCECGVNLSAPARVMEHELFAAHVEERVLDAVLAFRPDCPTCQGRGYVARDTATVSAPGRCPSCKGSGKGLSALIRREELEQVGWVNDVGSTIPFNTAEQRAVQYGYAKQYGWDNLYRLRPESEGATE